MPLLPHVQRVLVAAVAVTTGVSLLPAPAQAAAPQLAVVVSDISAEPASPLTPWTYLGMQASADWHGLLYDARLQFDVAELTGVATVFVPSVGSDGIIRPDTQQCRAQGTVTTCAIGDRAPTRWSPLPHRVVQAAPGAPSGGSGRLTITVSGGNESGAPVGPIVATPAVTVAR